MRDAFIRTLLEEARINPDVLLIVGDLGFSVIEPFASDFPNQFLNAGVAEQSMMGTAAGMASLGYRCFVYSIANFSTLRCLEQIRNDVCYHNLPVTVVSVGAGVSYGSLGYTHHAIEDIAAIRALPNITIGSPCDSHEAESLTRWFVRNDGPGYLRLGKNGEPLLHAQSVLCRPGQAHCLRSGDDKVIAVTGGVAALALSVAEELQDKHGISVEIWSFPFVSHLDIQRLDDLLSRFSRVFTLEDHVRRGGFGSAMLELSSDLRFDTSRLRNLCLSDQPLSTVGSADFIRKSRGINVESVMKALLAD